LKDGGTAEGKEQGQGGGRMQGGDRVTRSPETFAEGVETRERQKPQPRAMTGRVVYIHPRGRYHVVEFEVAGHRVRESFAGV